MSANCYYVIDYEISFLSDFHVGEGTTLVGGNLHGLRLDENQFPYMPHSQVKGLLKWGGRKLVSWQHAFEDLFRHNFPETRPGQGETWWAFTRAAFPPSVSRGWGGADNAGLLGNQAHIRCGNDTVENLFSYQKGKGAGSSWSWFGSIYSVAPAEEMDAAFLINCMRAEDRIGARRSRGYGKIDWRPSKMRRFQPGDNELEDIRSDLDFWVDRLFESEVTA